MKCYCVVVIYHTTFNVSFGLFIFYPRPHAHGPLQTQTEAPGEVGWRSFWWSPAPIIMLPFIKLLFRRNWLSLEKIVSRESRHSCICRQEGALHPLWITAQDGNRSRSSVTSAWLLLNTLINIVLDAFALWVNLTLHHVTLLTPK